MCPLKLTWRVGVTYFLSYGIKETLVTWEEKLSLEYWREFLELNCISDSIRSPLTSRSSSRIKHRILEIKRKFFLKVRFSYSMNGWSHSCCFEWNSVGNCCQCLFVKQSNWHISLTEVMIGWWSMIQSKYILLILLSWDLLWWRLTQLFRDWLNPMNWLFTVLSEIRYHFVMFTFKDLPQLLRRKLTTNSQSNAEWPL